MKKRLANFLIILRNFLNRIASRLDKQFHYLHIELLPNGKNFTFSYDNQTTLDSIYSFGLQGGLKLQFEAIGAKSLLVPVESKSQNIEDRPLTLAEEIAGVRIKYDGELIPEPKKIYPNKIVIAWEHYKTNYLDKSYNLKEDGFYDEDDEDFDDEEDGGVDIEDMMPPGLMRFGMMQNNKPTHYTPWGKFEHDNPLSPVRLYELQMVHFKGFSSKNIVGFKELISSVEGIAIWGQIDPHCIIIAPAKLYEFQEIKYNLESAIYNALNIEPPVVVENLTANLDNIRQKSLDLYQRDGIKNISMIFPDEDNTVEVINDFSNEDLLSVDNLIRQVKGLVVFINGELYYES